MLSCFIAKVSRLRMPTLVRFTIKTPEKEMGSKPQVVFFDVGNTLLFPNRGRIHAPLTALGIQPETDLLSRIERQVKNEFDSLMTRDGSHDHSFWSMFYSQLLAELGVQDDAICNQLVTNIRNSANWDVIPEGTREQLAKIGARNPIAVISNADGRIEDVLRRCNIADCFRTITDSGIVGYEKPHPEIFRQALKSMNAAPEESLYVGDVYSVDYLGAKAVGMQAILMDVSGAYREKGLPRVESLVELQAKLAC